MTKVQDTDGQELVDISSLTIEQEAALVLEQMARLMRENREATEAQRYYVEQARKVVANWEAAIAEVNAERDAALAKLEERAKGLGLRAEQTIETEHGVIKFKNGYPRVTYDAKGLDAVSKAPEHGWLRQYRSETLVMPTVTKVEVKVDEAD